MSKTDQDLRNTPLYNKHVEEGAKMVPFSGWAMPLQYSGIIDEHIHTRKKAGLFDICHMGEFMITGSSAEKDLDILMTCHIDDMTAGRCRYGFLLNNNGGIIDDLIIFKIGKEEFMLVVNSATTGKDKKWLTENISSETVLTDISRETAKIDIQGPASSLVLEKIIGYNVEEKIGRYRFEYIDIDDINILLSRTGYTGEIGYEMFFNVKNAEKIWNMLRKQEDVKPVGLGARDTLRMEMGYSLYGNDIDEKHSPVESNLSRFAYMEKEFIGKDALIRQEKNGVKMILTGFTCEGRRSARRGFTVIINGQRSGTVTSGSFSPSLQKGIGLCYIDIEEADEGKDIKLTNGKIEINAVVAELPIYRKK